MMNTNLKIAGYFRGWFANQSIQKKLGLINFVILLMALVPVLGVTLSYEYVSIRQDSIHEAETQADIIRDNIAAAAAFRDQSAAEEILASLKSSPSTLQAMVVLTPEIPLAHYIAEGEMVAPLAKALGEDATWSDEGAIRVDRVINFKGDVVGWLVVETSTRPLQDRIALYFLVNILATLIGFVIALRLAEWLTTTITGPLRALTDRAELVTKHRDYSRQSAPNNSTDEIGHLARAFDSMIESVRQHDINLTQIAYHDKITGLPNRHFFAEQLQRAVESTKRYGRRCCVMFIDLDHFKKVNDTYGHEVGDDLLRLVATKLTAESRTTDFVSRLGGDEFAIVIDGIEGLEGPCMLAQKIIAALSMPLVVQSHTVKIGASIGLAVSPDHAGETDALLRAADSAMYRAKKEGKNCYRVFCHDLDEIGEIR